MCLYDHNSLYLFFIQAADIKILGSLNRDDLKKICGDNFPIWISFPVYEQVGEISVDQLMFYLLVCPVWFLC